MAGGGTQELDDGRNGCAMHGVMGEHDVACFDDEGDVGRVAEFGADDLVCSGNSVA